MIYFLRSNLINTKVKRIDYASLHDAISDWDILSGKTIPEAFEVFSSAPSMEKSIAMIGQISDEIARILWHQMKAAGDADTLINNPKYHVTVKTIEERDAIDYKGILNGDKLYVREEGLRVLVIFERIVYELQNNNWIEINKFDDGTYTEI